MKDYKLKQRNLRASHTLGYEVNKRKWHSFQSVKNRRWIPGLTHGECVKYSFLKRNALVIHTKVHKFPEKQCTRSTQDIFAWALIAEDLFTDLDFGGSRGSCRPMGNEHSAFCGDSAECCGRSSSQRSENLIDIVISKESRPKSRPESRPTSTTTSPLVEFDRSAWLREHQEPNNKPQDEGPDRLGALKAARADRRRAHAVLVHPVAALTLRQFALSPLLYLQPKWGEMCRRKNSSMWPSKDLLRKEQLPHPMDLH
jgi:hypothetical protein